jgi:hypothetical protein
MHKAACCQAANVSIKRTSMFLPSPAFLLAFYVFSDASENRHYILCPFNIFAEAEDCKTNFSFMEDIAQSEERILLLHFS